jgi:LysB family phage lysis regulatory protein
MTLFNRIALPALIVLLFVSGFAIRIQDSQLKAAQARMAEFTQANASLTTANQLQASQLVAMQRNAESQAAATLQLADRLDRLDRQSSANAVKLEAAIHATPAAIAWGSTAIPADVARLLDTTTATAASSPAGKQSLPTGDSLPTAGTGTEDQPAAGGKPAAAPDSTGALRGADRQHQELPAP